MAQLEEAGGGVWVLQLDAPGRAYNVLDAPVLAAVRACLAQVSSS